MDTLKRTFWYLGTPYSKYPHGLDDAFRLACRVSADLIGRGIPVFSPIAHTHPIAVHGGLDPFDYDIWLPADQPFIDAARGLIVVRAAGWTESKGLEFEIAEFRKQEKSIVYIAEDNYRNLEMLEA